MIWQAIKERLPFRLRWRATQQLQPDPQNYAYDSYGQIPFSVSPNSGAGGVFFDQLSVVSPGMYQNMHTVLVGQPPIYDNVNNQPLGYPGDTTQ